MEGEKQFTSWENREREILESLSLRVETAEELKKTIEAVTLEQSNEEVSDHLEDCFQKLQSRFPRETIDNFQRLLQLEEELKEIEIELLEAEEEFDEDISEADKKIEIEKVNQRLEKYNEHIKLLENLDVRFLQKIKRIIENLIRKNKYIGEVLEDRDIIVNTFLSLKTIQDEGIERDDIDKVSFEPFSIIFNIQKSNNKFKGSCFRGTPFIAVCGTERIEESDKELILEHEKTHNFLEGAELGQNVITFGHLKRRLSTWEKFKDISPRGMKEKQREMIKKIKYFHLINNEHEEISAAIKQFMQSGFKPLSIKEKEIRAIFGMSTKRKTFSMTIGHFSTAGAKMKEISKYLEDKIGEEDDEEIKGFLLELKRDVEEGFTKVGEDIEEVIKITQFLGKDAKEKVNILFLMLLPTQYRHIKSYLRYTYGEELMSEAEKKKKLIYNFDFTISFFEELAKEIEGGWEIDEKSKSFLLEEINSFDFFRDYDPLELHSIDDVRKYLFSAEKLLRSLDALETFKDFKGMITELFFYWLLEENITDQFQGIPEIYNNLTSEEKEAFKSALASYIEYEVKGDLGKMNIEISSLEEIKNLPLWDIIKEIGEEDEILKIIEEQERSEE